MIHLVALDRKPMRAVTSFIKALETNSDYYWKMMFGVWVVDTQLSTKQLTEALSEHTLKTDSLLVVRLHAEYNGHLEDDKWEWLLSAEHNCRF